ncbi:probable folate-biopterin transporter 6 [Setaria italica]|uniref:probable folate-biopterin transporter 6 n=1 Tax=Setaria italica TaxID=4555 RepID=UPI000BE530C7|nr:probable folate-biopterin transporter 6 [Setaria italica]
MLEEDGAMDADHLVGEEPGSPAREPGGEPAWAAAVLEPVRWVRMLCRELGATFEKSFMNEVMFCPLTGVQETICPQIYIFNERLHREGCVSQVEVFDPVVRILGTVSATIVAMATGLPVSSAVLCLVGISTAVAIADVTIDACIAKNSIDKPALAPDMQSLCAFSSSLGALIGYATSGMFVHHLGAQGALGVMAIPPATVVFLGFFIYELKTYQHNAKEKVLNKVSGAVKGMVRTIKYPVVWKPSLYMFLSLALSISTHEGQFYWYTNKTPPNPGFLQEFVGLVHAIGAVASMVGVLIYHKCLKDYPFRSILFCAQLLYGVSGLLDLTFVLRWNLALGVPDAAFVILEECVSRVVGRVRLMPMMVLSTKLCPPGVEGTFFALLMCIDSLGMLAAKAGGAAVLRALHVTRDDFARLWLAVLLRNALRLATLGAICLVPTADQTDVLVPRELLVSSPAAVAGDDEERLQLAMLTAHTDDV